MDAPPSEEQVFDFAIVGAGVSGLALAWLLCDGDLGGRTILLIDGASDDEELRTLSFWSTGPIALEALVRWSWRRLRLHDGERAREVTLEAHRYATLLFADLQRETKARLAGGAGHRVVEARLQSLEEDEAGVTLLLPGQRLRARWVFDSRFQLPRLTVDERRFHSLRQHFHGWVVRAPRPVFDSAVATLFDFRVDGPRGTAFCYLLPRSPSEALVELVTLSPVDAGPALLDYLRRTLDVGDVELLEREAGVSPLTEQPFSWRAGPRVRRIGIPAGRLKPSTGYALTRILDDSAAIVAGLLRRGTPMVAPPPARLYRLLDAVLLEVWEAEPTAIPGIFTALFARSPADRVLRFLDERASLLEVLRLGLSLPAAPLLRAVGRLLWRRIRGRPSDDD